MVNLCKNQKKFMCRSIQVNYDIYYKDVNKQSLF